MRGALRLSIAIWTAGLLLAPAAALAQDTTPPAAGTAPAAETVGPRELQNFSLQGTVTRSADRPAEEAAPPQPSSSAATDAPNAPRTARQPAARSTEAPRPAAPAPSGVKPAAVASAPVTSDFVGSSSLPTTPAPISTPATTEQPPSSFPTSSDGASAALAPEHPLLIWPWLLAAAVLGAAATFLFLRNRGHRTALAGGPQLDRFVAPEPAPPPRPTPPLRPPAASLPAAKPTPPPPGIISTSLRPWLDLSIEPLRCVLSEDQVTMEFELGLFNSGSGPARAVLIEAVLINAGPQQERELAAFFARPAGAGDRIDVIHPLKSLNFGTQVAAPRANIQAMEMAGRQVFVPLIAFNVLYDWGSKDGQTSVSYLLGRESKTGKLAPFRLDRGTGVVSGLGARLLPGGMRS